ncbi:MAG: hypothetical protein WC683_00995 [bacterium]
MTTLWHVLLERRSGPSWNAEVGAETFTEAIEWFQCWLIEHVPDFREEEIAVENGDHIGTCAEEGVQLVRFPSAALAAGVDVR